MIRMIERRYTVLCLIACICVRIDSQQRVKADEVSIVPNDRIDNQDDENSTCEFRISTDVGKFYPPLLLYPNTLQPVRAVSGARGIIRLRFDEAIRIVCPGAGNTVKNLQDQSADVIVRCAGGTKVSTPDKQTVWLRRLECSKWPDHHTIGTGTCLWGKRLITVGFSVPSPDGGGVGVVPVYESCFDVAAARTIYSRFLLGSDVKGAQQGVRRPVWRGRENFRFDPNHVYQKQEQRKQFARLLGSDELAAKYISLTGELFLSKGHLAAKADFLQGAAQLATFQHTNAAPQWQSFNGHNWNALENDVRTFVERAGRDIWCYTGAYGRATLPDLGGREVELFLGPNRTLAVPSVYWKVLHVADRQQAVAFVGVNNPYATVEQARADVRCRDICDRLQAWQFSWRRLDVRRGYTICCEVNDFRASFPDVLPAFAVVGVLGADLGGR